MEKVLLVCTVPALESYNVGVISAAFNYADLDCYACIFVNGSDTRTTQKIHSSFEIPLEKNNKVWIGKLAISKLTRILSSSRYLNQVKQYAQLNEITKIHFISQDVMLHGHLANFKDFKLYYTVHDLLPHPAKLSLLQKLKHYYFRIRKDKLLVSQIENLITNSFHQKETLERIYPKKRIFWHSMPSLVVPAIKDGTIQLEELKEVDQYVLFFGRVELYKGLEVLYQAFTNHPLLANLKLVIAGKGRIYFERRKDKESNVIFLNRYIADEEVASLFKKALFMVLPYHSATQTAITSLGYHFGIPIIATSIEGLKDTVIHEKTGLLYEFNSPDVLANTIIRLYRDDELRQNMQNFIATALPFFNEQILAKELTKIYL